MTLRRVGCVAGLVVLAAIATLGVLVLCECDTYSDPLRLVDGSIEGSWVPRLRDGQTAPTEVLALVADRSEHPDRPRYDVRWDGGVVVGCRIGDDFRMTGPGIDWAVYLDTQRCPCSERDPLGDRLFVDCVLYVRTEDGTP